MALPPRYPQVGKTVEGDKTAKRQRIAGRAFPDIYGKERPWREQAPPGALGVLDTRGRYGAAVAGLSLGVGAGLRIKERTVSVLETPCGRYGVTK